MPSSPKCEGAVVDRFQARLASANTSAGHKEAADSKSRFELEARVNKLESTVSKLKASEKEARDELAEILKAEKNNEVSVSLVSLVCRSAPDIPQADKEKRELQASLKATKADLAKKEQELVDVQEELSLLQDSSKEREKALKQKLKEVTLEKDRLAGLEVRHHSSVLTITDWFRTSWRPSEAPHESGPLARV